MRRGRLRFRRGPGSAYRAWKSLEFLATRDRAAVARFLLARWPRPVPLASRIGLIRAYVRCTNAVRGYHTLGEMLTAADRILRHPGRPRVVECGTGKGASTAKLSLAVRLAGGRMTAFDSFRGIPPNDEVHESADGRPLVFRRGAFAATLPAVRRVVERYGAPEVCSYVKGWFEETLPRFEGPVDVALVDVDLLSSTRTCLAHLAPRMPKGGTILTHDGHIRAIASLLRDGRFWTDEIGIAPPTVRETGEGKLVEIVLGATNGSSEPGR